ncbi:MAG: hypothetical protein HY736_04955 [Verrucomicrobia bacterium]|nr:hypothetical protein [Verrucomicrobiota bacterium]
MRIDDKRLLAFLGPQLRDFGGKVEIDPDLWVLLAVETADEESNELARWLLAGARFPSGSGPSEDDRWTLYYVNTVDRAEAVHWLDETSKVASGQIRPTSPAQRTLIRELARSGMPHRVAKELAEQHARGKLSAGSVQEPDVMRALLDRLHFREPLFYSALQTLLNDHLIDMIALHRQLIAEDLSLEDEIGPGALSRDPFLKTGQIAAVEIRNVLIRFHIINPLDQGTNTVSTNPYQAYMEIIREGGRIMAPIDGNTIALPRQSFVDAIHATRRNLYWGSAFSKLDSHAPWMREEIAYSFRFIKQRLESRRDLSPIDGLYMLERAVED